MGHLWQAALPSKHGARAGSDATRLHKDGMLLMARAEGELGAVEASESGFSACFYIK